MIYHPIKLGNGTVIYLPSSLQPDLYKFVDMSKMVQDTELDRFKRKVSGKVK